VHLRGGAEAAATAGAERAADAAEANLLENLTEKLDEFGRDENVELREEMSRRASKRTAQYSTPPAQPQVCSTAELITVDAYCACQLWPSKIVRHNDTVTMVSVTASAYYLQSVCGSSCMHDILEYRPSTSQSQGHLSLLLSILQSAIVIGHCLLCRIPLHTNGKGFFQLRQVAIACLYRMLQRSAGETPQQMKATLS